MAYPISDVTRRVVYTGSAGVGPYSFTFEVLANTDIQVYKNTTLLTLTTNYTVTINANGTGSVTLVVAATGADTITIVGDRAIQRATDFVTGGDLFANTLNDEFDSLVIFAQQVDEKADRGLKAPVTDPTDVNMVLPVKASRKGKVLAFDSTSGDPVAGPALDAVTTVIEQSANINTVADNIASVNTVAGNNTNVTTVAGVSGAVTTVAGISSNVTTVAGISSNVTTVAGISANVTTVAGISSNVTTVAGNSSNVTTVATNISSVNTAATNIAAIIDAPNQATAAAASAAAAAASAASGMYSAVQDKSANYTVVAGDAGDLIRVTTTSGAVTITLPTISTVEDGFKVAIVKWTGDANAVTINRSGSDTINGATSSTIGSQYSQTTFVADFQTNQWFAASSGLGASNVAVDAFSGNGSTTAFTLSGDPGSENNTQVYVSGVYQEKDTYSVSGTTLTFSTAPPTGTSNIEVVWTAPLAIGTPSDGTVTTAKLADGALSADTTGRAKMADAFVTAAKLASTTGSGAVVLATSPTLTSPTISGTPTGVGVLTSGTAVASTSGTSIDFTSIPSWVKRITVMFSGVSTNGASDYLVQIGAGSVASTGYLGTSGRLTTAPVMVNYTTGFGINNGGGNSSYTFHGSMTITLLNSATGLWCASGVVGDSASNNTSVTGASKTLSGTLDRVRITTVNGTDTFDAGSVNILYE